MRFLGSGLWCINATLARPLEAAEMRRSRGVIVVGREAEEGWVTFFPRSAAGTRR